MSASIYTVKNIKSVCAKQAKTSLSHNGSLAELLLCGRKAKINAWFWFSSGLGSTDLKIIIKIQFWFK